MSLAQKAVHGAMWSIGASLAARAVGLIGTVVITYFLSPDVVAEVNAAAILVMWGNLLSNFGLGNYYIVKGDEAPEVAFHMTAYSLSLGVLGLGIAWLVDDPVGAWFELPGMVQYVPGMVLAFLFRRIGSLPSKVLVREMRFSRVAMARAAGEVSFVVSSIALAAWGWGGQAIVIGNIIQGGVEALLMITGTSARTWLSPCKLQWERTKDMFRFGIPLGLNAFIGSVSQNVDRLIYSKFFGPTPMGLYQYAYRLAEIPAVQLGEQVSDVLLPSMSKIDIEARKRAAVRSTAIMCLVIIPLAMGLAAVSESLIAAIFDEQWQGVAPLVTLLSAMSIFYPVSQTLGSYLTTRSETRVLVIIEIVKIIALVAGMAVFSLLGPLWICAGVVFSYAVHAVMSGWVCVLRDGMSARGLTLAVVQPLLACVPMVAAVLGCRYGLHAIGIHSALVSTMVEISVGAAVYVPAAFVLAPAISRDFLNLLKNVMARRR